MKRWLAGGSAIALGLLLSGCGGGGTASTPPPTYTKLADLTGNRTFQSAGIHFTVGGNNPFAGDSSQKLGAGVTIAYTASSDSYMLTAPDGTTETFSTSTSTPPPGFTPQPNHINLFNPGGGTFNIWTPSVNGVPLSYTALGSWFHPQNGSFSEYVAVSGVPTIASDMPRGGTANYQTSLSAIMFQQGTIYTSDSTSSATFSANFGAGTVATTLHLVGVPSHPATGSPTTPMDFGSFSGSGTIAAGSPGFSGTLASTASSPIVANGEFSGAFFGPQAKEMGFGFYVNGAGFSADGAVAGTK